MYPEKFISHCPENVKALPWVYHHIIVKNILFYYSRDIMAIKLNLIFAHILGSTYVQCAIIWRWKLSHIYRKEIFAIKKTFIFYKPS